MSTRKGAKAKAKQAKAEDALAEIEQVFQDNDPGETGILEREVAMDAVYTLGITSGAEAVELMDPNNDGFVTSAAFTEIAMSFMTAQDMDETAARAFNIFDNDHSGSFTFETLKSVAKNVGEDWSENEMREMFEIADKNHDGVIDRDEFIDIMERIGLS